MLLATNRCGRYPSMGAKVNIFIKNANIPKLNRIEF